MFKSVLIINPFGIGDVLFTTPLIHTLKDISRNIKIGYLCNSRTASLLRANPHIDSIIVYERDEFDGVRKSSAFAWLKKIFNFIDEIKSGNFELVLDFSLNTQYGFFCWLAGIRERIGYDFKRRGRFLTKKIKLAGYNNKHIVLYYVDLLKYLGIDIKYNRLELYLTKQDEDSAELMLAREGLEATDYLVGIIPAGGTSWGDSAYLKRWPQENFSQIADKLVENYSATIIILGNFSEKEIADNVVKQMKYKALNLCGLTSLGIMAALLNKMKLVITNDGGPLHMAAALGVKTVSIFGPVDERVYGPYPPEENRHIVIKKELDCRPCYRNFRLNQECRERECVENIGVTEVFEAATKLLK